MISLNMIFFKWYNLGPLWWYSRKEQDLRQTMELQNLRPATPYAVRVATGNQVGVSMYTAPIHFTTPEEGSLFQQHLVMDWLHLIEGD